MDIIASLTTSPTASTQSGASSQPQDTSDTPFSKVLSQVSEASTASDSAAATATPPTREVATAVSNPRQVPASTASEAHQAPLTAPAPSGLAATVSVAAPPEVPQPDLEPSRPATLVPLNGGLNQSVAEDFVDGQVSANADDLSLSTLGGAAMEDGKLQDSDTASDTDNRLEDIRQRLELIQSAGQADTTSMLVAPAVPLQVNVQALPNQADGSSDAQALPGGQSNASVSSLASTALAVDGDQDSEVRLDVQDRVQTQAATLADTLQDPRPVTHSAATAGQDDADGGSDASSSMSLASLTANTNALAGNRAATNTPLVLASAIGSGQWQNSLGQQMIDMVTRGDQQVDLQLHPAELGPLSISLNLSDGNTQAQFQSAHASVRAAVEQALPQLREALASQGIALGQASVSDQSSRQTGGEQAHRNGSGARTDGLGGSAEGAPHVLAPVTVQRMVASGSGVDLYV